MMNRSFKCRAVWVLLYFILWGVALYLTKKVQNQNYEVGVRQKSVDTTMKVKEFEIIYESMREEGAQDLPEITVFKNIGKIQLVEPDTQRSVSILGFDIWGDKSKVSGIPSLFGSYGIGDAKECVLSTKAAMELFQSKYVNGSVLLWKGEEWLVRGVFPHDEAIVLLTAGRESEFNQLELRFKQNREDIALEAERLLGQYGLGGDVVMVDRSLYAAIAHFFLMLPWFPLLGATRKVLRGKIQKRWLVYMINTGCLVIGVLLFFNLFHFPSSFIPSQWSNLDFWSNQFRSLVKNIGEINESFTYFKDDIFFKYIILSSIVSVIVMVAFSCILHWDQMLSSTDHNDKCNQKQKDNG